MRRDATLTHSTPGTGEGPIVPTGHLIILGVVGLAALAIIVGGAAAIVTILRGDSAGFGRGTWATETSTETLPASGLSAMRVSTTNGKVVVNGSAEAQTILISAVKAARAGAPGRSREALSDIRVIVEREDGVLKVHSEHPQSSPSGCSFVLLPWRIGRSAGSEYRVDYEVALPASFVAEVHSTNGAIAVNGLRGATVSTTNGHVTVANAEVVDARTTNGGITVDGASGPVNLSTTNGSIRARVVGAVRETAISTTNGGIRLAVPGEANAELDIATRNGRITVEGLDVRNPRATRNNLHGILGVGGSTVKLRTVNGSVTVTGE